MIISNKHKFIFMKTRKTAGSSMQVALSTVCDTEDDIITGSNIKNDVLDESHSAGWNMGRFFTKHPHPPIAGVRQWVGDKWNNYYKFAFVRNPFDIAVSRYHWNVKGKQGGTETSPEGFRKWVKEYYIGTRFYQNDLQFPYICNNNGEIDLDFIGKYENIETDYEYICKRIGLNTVPEMGFQKSGFRDKTPYQKYYDHETINIIAQAFQKDLELFGYKFELPELLTITDKQPIITQELAGCKNINGPSLIKVPDWVVNPLGKYYLYFADHQGKHIKMAYSDKVEGPYKLYDGGTLQLNQTDANTHIASPDVHVQDKNMIMYFHGDTDKGQVTWRAETKDGLNWDIQGGPFTPFYHREFTYQGERYAICKNKNVNSHIYKYVFKPWGEEYDLQFEFLEGSRHTAVHVDGDSLYIFYTLVGESPERIYCTKLIDWEVVDNFEVTRPTEIWEGVGIPEVPSKYGMSHGFVNQLRDPCVYEENGNLYLLYSYGGESGIAFGYLKKF